MPISRRVTARFNKRERRSAAASLAAPPVAQPEAREKIDTRNLPAIEIPVPDLRSELLTAPAQVLARERPEKSERVEAPRPASLSAHLREARARAAEIIRQHPCRDELTGPACPSCVVSYPCDAVRAARDVIALSERLSLRPQVSGEALLALMADLVGLGARSAPLRDARA